jgi:glucose-6-phosphate dehydrogenase assembly protein OpcA
VTAGGAAHSSISPPAPASAVIARVEKELRDLWAVQPGEEVKARACTMNLVVVAGPREIADRYTPIVDDVTRGVPARAIVVAVDPDAHGAALEADTTAVCTKSDSGEVVCSERVRLVALGGMCERVGSAIDALCVPEIPTTVVWLGRVHTDDPVFLSVAAEANRIVLDTDYTSLTSLLHLARWVKDDGNRATICDMAWVRLATWQELCARFFDEPRIRELASKITRLTVRQASDTGARLGPQGALLIGWLATRLGWRSARVGGALRMRRPDGGMVTIQLGTVRAPPGVAPGALAGVTIEADGDGRTKLKGTIERELGSGLAGQSPDADVIVWRLEVGGAPPMEQRLRLGANRGARVLERTLHRPSYDAALVETVAFAEEVFEDAPTVG